MGNLTQTLQLPAGAITLDSLQEAAPSTSQLAVSEAAGTRRLLRLLLADQPAAKQTAGTPTYLTATVSLDPDSAAESGGQFSAAWLEASLAQVAAQQEAGAPVQLEGASVTR